MAVKAAPVWILLCAAAVSSCAYLRALQFQADEKSGIPAVQRTELIYLSPDSPDTARTRLPELGPEFSQALSGCLPSAAEPRELLGAILVPLVGFAVQQAVSSAADQLASRIEEIQRASQRTYAARRIIDDGPQLSAATQCLVLIRGNNIAGRKNVAPEDIGLALVLRLDKRGRDAFIIVPTFLVLKNAVAITGAGEPLDLAVAVTGSAALENEEGHREIVTFGQSTFTFRGVPLTNQPATRLPESTGLLALPPRHSTALELSVAITESGNAVPDAARARAELTALAEALGPALAAHLTSNLQPK